MPMDARQLKPILEAALLAAPRPMTPVQLAELFDLVERPSLDVVAQALAALVEDSAERGVELVEVASGFRYQIRTEVFPHLGALWTERQSRYSRALLETLALIAYRQPITRGEIEQIRGVGVATSILRTIEEREWVRVVGHRDVPGRPALYGTTKAFLDYFKLHSLDELPPLSALSDLDSMEPDLLLAMDGLQPAANDPAADADNAGIDTADSEDTSSDGAVADTRAESETVIEADIAVASASGEKPAIDIEIAGDAGNDATVGEETAGSTDDDHIDALDETDADVLDDTGTNLPPANRSTD